MKEDPKFSLVWRIAIIVAIVLPLLGGGSAERRRQADERRFQAIEKSIKEIESYLYKEVAPPTLTPQAVPTAQEQEQPRLATIESVRSDWINDLRNPDSTTTQRFGADDSKTKRLVSAQIAAGIYDLEVEGFVLNCNFYEWSRIGNHKAANACVKSHEKVLQLIETRNSQLQAEQQPEQMDETNKQRELIRRLQEKAISDLLMDVRNRRPGIVR